VPISEERRVFSLAKSGGTTIIVAVAERGETAKNRMMQ